MIEILTPIVYNDSLPISSIEDLLSNETLIQAFNLLSSREKEILTNIYLYNQTEIEVAKKLAVSQQAISKTKKKALLKINKLLN